MAEIDINFVKVILGEKIDSCSQQFIPSTLSNLT